MQVAKIIDCYTVAITSRDGPHLGAGDILVIGSEEITDPENGERLGYLATLRVKVTEVYDKFVIAETYRLVSPREQQQVVTVNIGDQAWAWPGRNRR